MNLMAGAVRQRRGPSQAAGAYQISSPPPPLRLGATIQGESAKSAESAERASERKSNQLIRASSATQRLTLIRIPAPLCSTQRHASPAQLASGLLRAWPGLIRSLIAGPKQSGSSLGRPQQVRRSRRRGMK